MAVGRKTILFFSLLLLITLLLAVSCATGSTWQSGASGPERAYKVGSTGPAGGSIFYDKGFFSDGWRYMEAAPQETEFTAFWDEHYQYVPDTDTAVGAGKQNTLLINNQTEPSGNYAARLCANLEWAGFTDWFLPSKDELDLMYKNLRRKGLGNFGDIWYWSSSQTDVFFAWDQHFGDGRQDNGFKNSKDLVRAVRSF